MFASVLSLMINYIVIITVLFGSVGRNLPTEETRKDFKQ